MNRFAKSVIGIFTSRKNISDIKNALNQHYRNELVSNYLDECFEVSIEHFVEVIEQELLTADPMPGTVIHDHVISFNRQFIKSQLNFIDAHVVAKSDQIPLYEIDDGLPTSRRDPKFYQKSADRILESWRSNSGRGVQAREDDAGNVHSNNPYHGKDNAITGITFCDQSEIGTQQHYDQFETAQMRALNRHRLPHEETIFGVSTPAADARLLSRRIFRKNEAGVENGIPRYATRLHNRYVDRDITEGLAGGGRERGYKLHGHDMRSLYARIDYKNKVGDLYNPTTC